MTGIFKALTVKQPWAWAIAAGGKDVENRSWATKYRGPVLIHAGKGEDSEAFRFPAIRRALGESGPLLPVGCVMGRAVIVGCHHSDDCDADAELGSCSEWALPGLWHWELDRRALLADPFQAKGKLGLWSLGPDDVPPLVRGLQDPDGPGLVAAIHDRLAAKGGRL